MEVRKKNIIIALMVAMFLAAVEGTVVTTAVPTIAKDLHGFEIISLVFSVYLLTSALSTPVYGKLSDLFGRKNILTIGIAIFLSGSVMCGLSSSIYMLIAFRAVQGLGAGSIFTVAYTIVGDVFTLEERPRVQGSIGTVWGVASLAGPFLGGFLIDTLSWHWVFFINVPFGILSILLLQKSLKENFEKKKHKIDIAGIVTFTAAMAVFLNLFLSEGALGISRPLFTALSAAVTVLLLAAFYLIERRAAEPIFPLDIFTKSSVIANIISFLASVILIGLDVYMPIYIQNVLGYNATVSGLVIAPMSVSWLLSSMIMGKYIIRFGSKIIVILAAVVLLASMLLMVTLSAQTPLILVILYAFIIGFGFGGSFNTLMIVVQSSVPYHKRGAATAANSLLRALGQTIGVSVLGGLFNSGIVRYFSAAGIGGIDPGNLYTAAAGTAVTPAQIKLSQSTAITHLFIVLAVLAALCIAFAFITPKIDHNKTDG